MTHQPEFPNLRNLMECYFNQDYDLYGDSDADILRLFKNEASYRVDGAISEMDSFLNMPHDGLLERYRQETGYYNMLIGETDAEAYDWLVAARRVLTGESE